MSFEVQSPVHADSLADVLERVLDKGIVIAGDVTVSLVGIELVTIKLRLLVASVDKARELGINWWTADPTLTVSTKSNDTQTEPLLERIRCLEQELANINTSRS